MEEILDFILDEQELLAGLSFRYIHYIDVHGGPAGPRGAQGCAKAGGVSACFSHGLVDDQAVSERELCWAGVWATFSLTKIPAVLQSGWVLLFLNRREGESRIFVGHK